jgi:predicted HAD superfamily Cof-like phosphohydrolase
VSDTDDVREFMEACGQDVRTDPGVPVGWDVRLLRARLVVSEALELCDALGVEINIQNYNTLITNDDDLRFTVCCTLDLVAVADACADLRYVVVGTELALGVPGDAVFDEVHRSNMTKVLPDGSVVLDEGGKVVKPPGFSPPDVAGVLVHHGVVI